jgi:dolichol kinase
MWFLIALTLVAMTLDLVRIHDRRVRKYFRQFFGRMIREHERFNLLGSTYLLIASLLAVEIFPRPVAAAAIGFTVLGDAIAALVGKAWGRTRFFRKTLEGTVAGFGACLLWAAFLATAGFLPWHVAVAGALVASLIEMLPIPLDDNLGMTLFAGYTMKFLGASG